MLVHLAFGKMNCVFRGLGEWDSEFHVFVGVRYGVF